MPELETEIPPGLHILLVDDDRFMQLAVHRILTDIGFATIRTADDGQEALEILGDHEIDILLTDIQMPNLNGLELLQKIRCGYGDVPQNLKIVILTSFSDVVTMGSAIALDVNAFLTKPFTPETVSRALHQTLSEGGLDYRDASSYMDVATELGDSQVAYADALSEAELKPKEGEQETTWWELQPNMQLARDVHSEDGVLLLAAGFVLSQRSIYRLRDLAGIMKGKVYFVVSDKPPDI